MFHTFFLMNATYVFTLILLVESHVFYVRVCHSGRLGWPTEPFPIPRNQSECRWLHLSIHGSTYWGICVRQSHCGSSVHKSGQCLVLTYFVAIISLFYTEILEGFRSFLSFLS
jgi:hypothetical protein